MKFNAFYKMFEIFCSSILHTEPLHFIVGLVLYLQILNSHYNISGPRRGHRISFYRFGWRRLFEFVQRLVVVLQSSVRPQFPWHLVFHGCHLDTQIL